MGLKVSHCPMKLPTRSDTSAFVAFTFSWNSAMALSQSLVSSLFTSSRCLRVDNCRLRTSFTSELTRLSSK
eukprot:Skav229457  [mRNA]  locus=scaffold397:335372:337121:- [translate_table: standard]